LIRGSERTLLSKALSKHQQKRKGLLRAGRTWRNREKKGACRGNIRRETSDREEKGG